MDRIKVLFIIKSHLKTLTSFTQQNGPILFSDLLFFFFTPFVAGVVLAYKKIYIDSQIGNLIAIISIFGGFLFNLLAIIYGYLKDIQSSNPTRERLKFAREINSNIAFCILLSVFSVIGLLIYAMLPPLTGCDKYLTFIKQILLAINYFFLFCFVFTLLMVLSRIFILLQRDRSD